MNHMREASECYGLFELHDCSIVCHMMIKLGPMDNKAMEKETVCSQCWCETKIPEDAGFRSGRNFCVPGPSVLSWRCWEMMDDSPGHGCHRSDCGTG